MIRRRITSLALAVLLTATAAVLAQPADDESSAPAAAETPEKPGPGDSATTTDAAAVKPAGATRSPSDYRSSEKISEDVPVSFPVDI
jgi:hypothetical protein